MGGNLNGRFKCRFICFSTKTLLNCNNLSVGISKGSSIDISNDPNCNQTTKICTMDLNKSYTTAKVKYTVPSTNDTVYFKVNNSIVPICRLNVNTGTGSSKDILLNFLEVTYTI